MQTISYGQLLRRNRDYRRLWGGQVVSQLGDWFSLITLQSLLLTLTGSASSLAALMIAQMLPLFLLSPAAGVVVDRLPRKHVMIAADLGRAGIALGFLLVRDGETAWLVRPNGERFFSLGVCCVNQGASRKEFDSANPGYAAWQHQTKNACKRGYCFTGLWLYRRKL